MFERLSMKCPVLRDRFEFLFARPGHELTVSPISEPKRNKELLPPIRVSVDPLCDGCGMHTAGWASRTRSLSPARSRGNVLDGPRRISTHSLRVVFRSSAERPGTPRYRECSAARSGLWERSGRMPEGSATFHGARSSLRAVRSRLHHFLEPAVQRKACQP